MLLAIFVFSPYSKVSIFKLITKDNSYWASLFFVLNFTSHWIFMQVSHLVLLLSSIYINNKEKHKILVIF